MSHISDQSSLQRALQTLFRGAASGARGFSQFNQGQIDRDFQKQQLADAAGRRALKGEQTLSKALSDREFEGVKQRETARHRATTSGQAQERIGISQGNLDLAIRRFESGGTKPPKPPPDFIGQIRKATQARSKEFLTPGELTDVSVDESLKQVITKEEFQALAPFIQNRLGLQAVDSIATRLGLNPPQTQIGTQSQVQTQTGGATQFQGGTSLLQEVLKNPNAVIGLPPGPQQQQPPPNDGSYTPEEYQEFVRRWRASQGQ